MFTSSGGIRARFKEPAYYTDCTARTSESYRLLGIQNMAPQHRLSKVPESWNLPSGPTAQYSARLHLANVHVVIHFQTIWKRLPTDIIMGFLTRMLVNDIEGNRDYLESFEDVHVSL